MPRKDTTLSERQKVTLKMIVAAIDWAKKKNARARVAKDRVPLGHLSRPDRTLYSLEHRGFAQKAPLGTSGDPRLVWTITEEGRRALDANP